MSSRYAGSTIYGVDDLDHYGNWRVVPNYGSVWVPDAVPAGWAPYSTGRWVADPYYGWTWVDTAPWGWAPYHHGRWVYVDSYWAWAPGPIVVRPVYSPALVVFFGRPGVQVAVGSPFVSWVALGWGEPIIPWWGSPRYIGRAHWAGWGGPRVVNNVVINRTTVVNVTNINVYRNVHVHNAVVAVREDNFGRRGVHDARVRDVDVRRLEPVRGRLHVKPDQRELRRRRRSSEEAAGADGRPAGRRDPATGASGAPRRRAEDHSGGRDAGADDRAEAHAGRHDQSGAAAVRLERDRAAAAAAAAAIRRARGAIRTDSARATRDATRHPQRRPRRVRQRRQSRRRRVSSRIGAARSRARRLHRPAQQTNRRRCLRSPRRAGSAGAAADSPAPQPTHARAAGAARSRESRGDPSSASPVAGRARQPRLPGRQEPVGGQKPAAFNNSTSPPGVTCRRPPRRRRADPRSPPSRSRGLHTDMADEALGRILAPLADERFARR